MRWLIWYFRSCFCSHVFEISEKWMKYVGDLSEKEGPKVHARCIKCGWHRQYWKF